MQRLAGRLLAGLALVLSLPLLAAAQTSGIAGEVKDSSGAVLPGVTVEVASPALIEPGAHRARALGDDGRFRPLHRPSAPPGHLFRHVLTARVQHREA